MRLITIQCPNEGHVQVLKVCLANKNDDFLAEHVRTISTLSFKGLRNPEEVFVKYRLCADNVLELHTLFLAALEPLDTMVCIMQHHAAIRYPDTLSRTAAELIQSEANRVDEGEDAHKKRRVS